MAALKKVVLDTNAILRSISRRSVFSVIPEGRERIRQLTTDDRGCYADGG
jgi:hypothetical protein